jgi:hypothetical protein
MWAALIAGVGIAGVAGGLFGFRFQEQKLQSARTTALARQPLLLLKSALSSYFPAVMVTPHVLMTRRNSLSFLVLLSLFSCLLLLLLLLLCLVRAGLDLNRVVLAGVATVASSSFSITPILLPPLPSLHRQQLVVRLEN